MQSSYMHFDDTRLPTGLWIPFAFTVADKLRQALVCQLLNAVDIYEQDLLALEFLYPTHASTQSHLFGLAIWDFLKKEGQEDISYTFRNEKGQKREATLFEYNGITKAVLVDPYQYRINQPFILVARSGDAGLLNAKAYPYYKQEAY